MTSATTGPRVRAVTYAGLFVVTMSMLAYEVALTRIFSVTMWYHFAFVAISLALFGTTAGALIVHFKPGWFTPYKVKRQMCWFTLLGAASMVLALVGQLAIPFRVEFNAVAIFSVIYTCALVAIPFTFVGVVVCLALTKFPDKVNRLYAADLMGAGVGCVVLFAGFQFFDGLSLVIFVAAVACAGALLLAIDAEMSQGIVVSGVAIVVLLAVAVANNANPFIKIIYGKEGEQAVTPLYEEWNPFSRVTVDGDPNLEGPPSGNGLSAAAPQDPIRQLGMLIDGTAGTSIIGYDGNPETTEFLRYDISNLHYHLLDDGFSAAVVGVGGGRDVLSALQFEAGDVTGIEINGDLLDLFNDTLGDFSGHVDQDPRVNYEVDEARSWLARTDQEFDSIQISLIDSWAATAAGAFSLTENTLYTVEAWDLFLDKLQPGGVLSVSRFFTHPQLEDPLEVLRTTVLAAEVLERRGVENARDHILIYEGPEGFAGQTVATVIVSPEPFSDAQVYDLGVTAGEMGFVPVLTPTESPDSRFAEIMQPGGPGPALGQFDVDLSAPTDDRPFFFQMASLSHVLSGETFGGDSHMLQGVNSLVFLGMGVLLLAAVCIGGPLWAIGRRTSHQGQWPHYLYFCGIGLAFLMVEISQLMRLSSFLGHPTYALVVVLFTVLIFSGMGSMFVEKLIDLSKPRSLLRPLAALLVVVALFGFLTPTVIERYDGATTPMRILVSIGILAPLALLMGMPFGVGMRVASAQGAPTAFLWGINGAMSVVSSVFAMMIAVFWGISTTFVAGFAAYLFAAGSMFVLVQRMERAPAEGEPARLDGEDGVESADADTEAEPQVAAGAAT